VVNTPTQLNPTRKRPSSAVHAHREVKTAEERLLAERFSAFTASLNRASEIWPLNAKAVVEEEG
jgi:hypothetical protein